MKILITGGSGYIAKSLYESLKEDHKVMSISRFNFDLTDKKSTDNFFRHRLFDVVIHCAVKGGNRLIRDNWSIMDDNLKMYYNLLDNSQNYDRLIHFGSGAELYAKDTPYGLSKSVIRESMYEKPNFFNLRIFGVFDENEIDTRFIKANIKRYINKKPIEIYKNKKMDFIFMPDLIKIVRYYIHNSDCPKEINCNYKNAVSLINIADIINCLDNYKVDIIVENQNGENYIANDYNYLPIDFIGLQKGIETVYKKLKNGN